MKIELQYVRDSEGKTTSVQKPFADLEKLMNKLEKYEKTLKIKTDLEECFKEVDRLRNSKTKKQTLKELIN